MHRGLWQDKAGGPGGSATLGNSPTPRPRLPHLFFQIEAYLDEQAGDANGEDGAGGGEDAEGEEEGDEKPAEGRGARRRSGSKAASKDDKPKE